MVKRITKQDRRLMGKIATRRSKGMTWAEIRLDPDIAKDRLFNSASHIYNWYHDRVSGKVVAA